jgi:hypothetical protein
MSLSPIKKVLGETTNWPNRKMFKVEKVSSTGGTYEANISPAELEIVKILNKLEGVLEKHEIDDIREKIETYGQDQYSLGSFESNQEF